MRLFVLALLVCLHSTGFCQSKAGMSQNSERHPVLFSRVNVVDVESGALLSERDVLVHNGRIVSIRKKGSAHTGLPTGTVIVSAEGKYLSPGLIDCHTHLMYKADLLPYLQNGVTTVFSLGQPIEVLGYREEVKTGRLASPTIYAAALIDRVAQDWEDRVYSYVVHSPGEVDTAIRRIRALRYDLIKAYNSLSTAEFDEVMRQAKAAGIPVIGHGVREPGMEHILSKGMAMVAHGEEYLYTFFRDSLDERKIPAAVAITKKYGAFVCPNLSTFHTLMTQWGDSLRFAGLLGDTGKLCGRVSPGMLQFWRTNNHYIHRQGNPLVPMYPFLQKLTLALHKAGVPLVTGTDSPVIPGCFPGSSLLTELQLLTEAGISPPEALKTATLVPGQFISHYLPKEQRTGVVKEGYAADLLLLSANPLENLEYLRKIEGVMVKGRWYPEGK